MALLVLQASVVPLLYLNDELLRWSPEHYSWPAPIQQCTLTTNGHNGSKPQFHNQEQAKRHGCVVEWLRDREILFQFNRW